MKYLSKEERQNIISVAALQVACEQLMDREDIGEEMGQAASYVAIALKTMMEGLDADQLFSIRNTLDTSIIRVMPRPAGKESNKGWVDLDDLEMVVNHSTSGCAFCDLSEREVKGCKIRKALYRLGFCGQNRADCPFKENI